MRGFALAALAALCAATPSPRLRPGDRLREFLSGGTIEDRIRDLRNNPKLQGGNDAQSGFFADFNGNSGSFKLFIGDNSTGGVERRRFWNLRWLDIAELHHQTGLPVNDGNGPSTARVHLLQPNSVTRAAGIQVLDDNVTMQYISVSSDLSYVSGAKFRVNHTRYSDDVNVTIPCSPSVCTGLAGGTPQPYMAVQGDKLKMTLSISGYQWHTSGNALRIRLRVSDNGRPNPDEGAAPDRVPVMGDRPVSREQVQQAVESVSSALKSKIAERAANRTLPPVIRMPGDGGARGPRASLAFEVFAIGDGQVNEPLPVNVTMEGNIISIVIPKFNSDLWYDPTIGMDTVSGSSSGAPAASLWGCMAALLLACVASMM